MILVIGPKGGVGTTTVAARLVRSLRGLAWMPPMARWQRDWRGPRWCWPQVVLVPRGQVPGPRGPYCP